jgi:hypothetical protein
MLDSEPLNDYDGQIDLAAELAVSFSQIREPRKTVTLSGGEAKFTTAKLAAGTHSITATYNGSSSFTGSSASLIQTVN